MSMWFKVPNTEAFEKRRLYGWEGASTNAFQEKLLHWRWYLLLDKVQVPSPINGLFPVNSYSHFKFYVGVLRPWP